MIVVGFLNGGTSFINGGSESIKTSESRSTKVESNSAKTVDPLLIGKWEIAGTFIQFFGNGTALVTYVPTHYYVQDSTLIFYDDSQSISYSYQVSGKY